MNPVFDQVAFLGFDVFGTVVDWRTSVAREVEPFLVRHAISVDPLQFASDWRGLYQPSMEEVRFRKRAKLKAWLLVHSCSAKADSTGT